VVLSDACKAGNPTEDNDTINRVCTFESGISIPAE
jgi:hypothetical protein